MKIVSFFTLLWYKGIEMTHQACPHLQKGFGPPPPLARRGTTVGRRYLKTKAFDFLDYRAFLLSVYHERKSSDTGFTYREFSRLCGFSSAGAIKLVVDGKRRMSLDAASRVAAMLRMPGEEKEYFLNLVRFNDARSDEERNTLFAKLKAAVGFRKVQEDAITQFEYYNKWYYVAIREMVSLDDFQEDPRWIARRLDPPITPAQAQAAVTKLLKMGFLVRDPEGVLRPAQPVISTEPEINSLAVKNFHRQMMKLGARSLETQEPNDRDVRSVTMAISKAQADRIKQMNIQYLKDVLDVVSQDDGVDTVYQLNIQWFSLVRDPDGEPGETEDFTDQEHEDEE